MIPIKGRRRLGSTRNDHGDDITNIYCCVNCSRIKGIVSRSLIGWGTVAIDDSDGRGQPQESVAMNDANVPNVEGKSIALLINNVVLNVALSTGNFTDSISICRFVASITDFPAVVLDTK